MAKAAKDRPAGAKSSTAKSGGAKPPASPPTPARKSTKAAPGIPSVRGPERQTSRNTPAPLSPEEVYRLTQETAYLNAKARGVAPGHEVQDWIEAEQEDRRRLEDRA